MFLGSDFQLSICLLRVGVGGMLSAVIPIIGRRELEVFRSKTMDRRGRGLSRAGLGSGIRCLEEKIFFGEIFGLRFGTS